MIRTLLAAAAAGAITVGGAATISLGSSPVTFAANCPDGTYENSSGQCIPVRVNVFINTAARRDRRLC